MRAEMLAEAGLFDASGQPRADLPEGWRKDLSGAGPWREAGDGFLAAPTPAWPPVILLEECVSTLDAAREIYARQPASLPYWAAVLAVRQSGGRGRMRRVWHSPSGNLYAAWRLPAVCSGLGNSLPILAGLAVVLGLEGLGGAALGPMLKWPNDVHVSGGKVSGILVEERAGLVLAGIGVNVVSAPEAAELRAEAVAPAASLAGAGLACTPLTLWRAIAGLGRDFTGLVLAEGPGLLAESASMRLLGLGRTGVVTDGDAAVRGAVTGLAPDGSLILRDGSGEVRCASGSLTFLD